MKSLVSNRAEFGKSPEAVYMNTFGNKTDYEILYYNGYLNPEIKESAGDACPAGS